MNRVSGSRSDVARDYKDEKRAALEAWARHLDQIITGTTASVVPITRGRR